MTATEAAPMSATSRRSCRRMTLQARRRTAAAGAAGATLLLLLSIAEPATGAQTAAWPCDGLLSPTPWSAPTVWWESGGSYFSQLRGRDGDLQLRSVLRLYPLAQRQAAAGSCGAGAAAGEVTQVCVALVDTTSYTTHGALENVAWVTLHTDALQPVAVVEVDADCWARERSSLSRCRPCVVAPQELQQLPLYRHSPLSREFWASLSSESMPQGSDPRRPWLHRINMQANANRSARAEWLRLAHLPGLRGLELTGNAWEDGAPQLPPLPALSELRLHNNRLTALPDDYLTQSPLLETLVLARNSLSGLPESIVNMKMLRLLDVTNPLPMGQSFSVHYIPDLPNLRILGLENQKIVGDIMPILMMPSLVFLNMSGCGLKDLGNPFRFSPHTSDLQTLDLSSNNLEVVPSSILSRFTKLARLLLNRNNLRVLGDASSLSLPKLDYLDVSQNHLKDLPELKPNSLKTLKARDNVLQDFSENFWESFPTLEILDLSQNRLTNVPVLKNQKNLQNLDLSQNEITVLHGLNFGLLNNLKSFNISHNLLTTVDSNVLNNFQELKIADLSHNRLWHISHLNGSMEIIDLSYNVLTNVPLLSGSSLYQLSLKRNLISSVNFTSVHIIKLRELDLSWNKITVADLANLTFDEVDLSFNSLRYMPTGSFKTENLKVEGNLFNEPETEKDEVPSGVWDSWFVWILGGIVALVVITVVLLVGVAILFRKLMKRSEPLVLPKHRSPSPVSFGETPAVRFK